jgi:hypothetical protein
VDKEPDRAQRELDQLVGLLKNGPCGVPAARWAEWIRNLPASNRAGGSEFMATVAGQLRLAASDYARRMGAFDVVS